VVSEKNLLAGRMQAFPPSYIAEILSVAARPEVISFAGGLPDPAFFPSVELAEASAEVLKNQAAASLQYNITEGFRPLREFIAARMNKRWGVNVSTDNILITNGAQQGMDLIGKVILDPGNKLLVENPTFIGALQAFALFQPSYVRKNLFTATKEEITASFQEASLAYLMPVFQNPTGKTYTEQQMQYIAEAVDKSGTFVIEDDAYGEIRFGEESPTPLIGRISEKTFYIGSFSKTMAPGLRLGWVVAPGQMMDKLVTVKRAADTLSNLFVQHVVYRYLISGKYDGHIQKIAAAYRSRCHHMLTCAKKYFPENVSLHKPAGGMYIWGELPEHIRSEDLAARLLQDLVAIVPGRPFYAHGDIYNTFRLNFSNSTEEAIEEGVKKIGAAIYRLM
jgi:2-aminoadipate transaminase